MKRSLGFAFFLLTGAITALPAFATTIVIVNQDSAGVGFNDTTAASPVGGNSGTTLGQQRLNVFQAAAAIWAAKINSSITIRINASFGPLIPCNPSQGVLGSAGPDHIYFNFANAPRANTWYPAALANAIAGSDLTSGDTEITAQFNGNIGTAGCLSSLQWYLGLDGNHGSNLDLEVVLLHEFGHGLGFTGFVDLTTGQLQSNMQDIFSIFQFDSTVGSHWNQMSDAQRLTSTTNNGNVVWDGPNVTGASTILSAGKDANGHEKLYHPTTFTQGSSVYHVDTTTTPNQLMEYSINSDLTHNVDVPNDLVMKAMLDMGWTQVVPVNPPTNVVATALTATSVQVSWTAAAGASKYQVVRAVSNPGSNSSFNAVCTIATTCPTGTSFTDSTASAGTAYIYKVESVDAGSNLSALSSGDLATTVIFTDPTLTTQSVKAAHLTELRTAINAICALASNPSPCATAYTDPTISAQSTKVKKAHVTELRAKLNAARSTLGLSAQSYADATITTSTPIRAAQINELRNGVK